ncbi:uncharacterized protein LOC144734930 isoform X1 [Lampetra planeri]
MAELFMECEEEELEPWQQQVETPDDDDEVECVEPTSPPATPTPPLPAPMALTRTILAVPSTSAAAGVPARSPAISVTAPSAPAVSSGVLGAPAGPACLPVPPANPMAPLTFGMLSTTGQNVLTVPTLTGTIAQGQNTFLLAPGYILNGMAAGATVQAQGHGGNSFVIQLQGGTQLPVMAGAAGQQGLRMPTMVQVPGSMVQAARPGNPVSQRLNIPVPVRFVVPPKSGLPQVMPSQGSGLFTSSSAIAGSSAMQIAPAVGAGAGAPVNLGMQSTVVSALGHLPRLTLKRGSVSAAPIPIDPKRLRTVVTQASYGLHGSLANIPVKSMAGDGLAALGGPGGGGIGSSGGPGAALSIASPASEYDKMDNRVPIPKGCPKCNLHFNMLDVLKRHMKVCCPEQLLLPERPDVPGMQLPKPTALPPIKPAPQKLLFSEGRLIMLVDDFYYGRAEGTRKHFDSNIIITTPFKCYSCAKVLKNNIRFMNHMKHHMELERQSNESWDSHTNCQHCFRQFPTPFQLQCHIESAHSACDAPTKCKICELNFDHEQMLLQHMKENHKPGEMPYVCQVCNFRSSVYAEVDSHFRAEHENTKSLLCPFCLKVIKSANGYLQHFMRHQNKGVFRCSKCRLQFLSKKDKMDHKTNHHKTHRKPRQLYGLTPGTKVTIRASLTTELLASANESMGPGSSSGLLLSPRATDGAYGGQQQQQQQQALVRSVPAARPTSSFSGRPKGSFQHCVECRLEVKDFVSHFPTYVHCSFCRYSTSCSRAFAEHMISVHTTRKPRFNMYKTFLWQMRGQVLACTCGVSHNWQSFDTMAKHLLSFPDHDCHLEISAEEVKDVVFVRRKRTNFSLYDDTMKAGFIRSLSLSRSRPGAGKVAAKSSDEVIVLDSDSDTELTEVSVTPALKATPVEEEEEEEVVEANAVPKLRISLGFLKPRGGSTAAVATRASGHTVLEPQDERREPRPGGDDARRRSRSPVALAQGNSGGESGASEGPSSAANSTTEAAGAGIEQDGDASKQRQWRRQQKVEEEVEEEEQGGITGTIEEAEEEARGSPLASEDEEAGLEGCCESDDEVMQRGDGGVKGLGADLAAVEEDQEQQEVEGKPRYSPISDASQVETERSGEEEDSRSGCASERSDRDDDGGGGEVEEEGRPAPPHRRNDGEQHGAGDEERGDADEVQGDGEEMGGDEEGGDRSEVGGDVNEDEEESGHGDMEGEEDDEVGGNEGGDRSEVGGDVNEDEESGHGDEEGGDGDKVGGNEGREDLDCDVDEGEGGDGNEGGDDEKGGDGDEVGDGEDLGDVDEVGVDEREEDSDVDGEGVGDFADEDGDENGDVEEEERAVNGEDVGTENIADVDEDVGEEGGDADEEGGDAEDEDGDAEDDGKYEGGDDGGDGEGEDGDGDGGAGGEDGGGADEESDHTEDDSGGGDRGEGRAGHEEGAKEVSNEGAPGGQVRGELEPLTPSEVLEQEASRILHADRKAAAVHAGTAGPAKLVKHQPLDPGATAAFKGSTIN